MRQTERIIGQQAAIEFAEKNCTVSRDFYVRKAKEGVPSWKREDVEKFKTLEVEGFSKLVELYEFSVYPEDTFREEPEHYVLEDPRIVLQIVKTGELLYPYETRYHSKKFGLCFVQRPRLLRLDGFTFDEKEPNNIGVGNEKKIEAWLGYLRRKKQAEIDYDANGRRRNKEFLEAVKARFPEARIRVLDDGWFVECHIKYGGIVYHYTAHDSGKFYRDTKLDYDAIVPTEQLLGIKG